MKTRLVLAVSGMLVAVFVGCDKPVDPRVESFIYPLAMGNQWVYDYQTITDYRGKKPNDTVTYSIKAAVVRVDTILPGIYSYALLATSELPEWPTPPPEQHYLNLPDGMYLKRSYTGTSMVLPKPHRAGHGVTFQGHQYEDLQTLLTTLIGPPGVAPASQSAVTDSFSLVLPYPQNLGQRWTCTQIGDDQIIGVDMLIAGAETVKNSAGSFDCHMIQWIYVPPMEDLAVVDFTSAGGLIRRRIEAHNLIEPSHEVPYDGDTVDIVATYELTSVQLH